MPSYFLSGRAAFDDAMALLDEHGDDAPAIAAERANASRDRENVLGFCHWRQIERFSALLASNEVAGSIH
jgi:hypothetical protein